MRLFLLLCFPCLLTACFSAQRTAPESSVYDFGLVNETIRVKTSIDFGRITAIDAIDHRRIRYRLAYQNPAQIHTYAHNRWADTPASLLTSKLHSEFDPEQSASCAIQIKIEGFDHVFSSPESSSGIVQLHVGLYSKLSQQILESNLLQATFPAASVDSKGGVEALSKASSEVLMKALRWAESAATTNSACTPDRS
jgi:ABC-type uncharacterized transport system auxiliary subunit